MLLDSNKLVSEISDELGFSSYRYFIIRFKKHFGVTPSQFNSDVLEKTEMMPKGISQTLPNINEIGNDAEGKD